MHFCKKKNKLYNAYSYTEIVETILVGFDNKKVLELIEKAFNRPTSEISSEDIKAFKDVYFVVDVKWKNSKCSIDDLSKKIARRIHDFENNVVSPERIEELSFTLDESTNHLLKDPECTICQESFEKNQELSRMPCGHSFHKMCIKKWTEIENNHENEDFSDEDFSEEDSIVDSLELIYSQNNIVEPAGLRSVDDDPHDGLNDYADYIEVMRLRSLEDVTNDVEGYCEQLLELANLVRVRSSEYDSEADTETDTETGNETDIDADTEADKETDIESDIEDGNEDIEIYDYEIDGDMSEFDFYDTDVSDAEIQTKIQCPNCRRYCW